MSTRYIIDSDKSATPVFFCSECPEFRQTENRSLCLRLNRDASGTDIPGWCPLGEIEDMVTSSPKLDG
jgi:hypothetical protein